MSSPDTVDAAQNAGMVIVSTRIFAAPQDVVFEAFSNPEKVKEWWGPDGFTNTIHELDLRVGGAFRLTMRGPNGADYENESIFTEVAVPEHVAYLHKQPRFTMEMTFTPAAEGTSLTWRMVWVVSKETNPKFREFITAANEQNFDRLSAFLARS